MHVNVLTQTYPSEKRWLELKPLPSLALALCLPCGLQSGLWSPLRRTWGLAGPLMLSKKESCFKAYDCDGRWNLPRLVPPCSEAAANCFIWLSGWKPFATRGAQCGCFYEPWFQHLASWVHIGRPSTCETSILLNRLRLCGRLVGVRCLGCF